MNFDKQWDTVWKKPNYIISQDKDLRGKAYSTTFYNLLKIFNPDANSVHNCDEFQNKIAVQVTAYLNKLKAVQKL